MYNWDIQKALTNFKKHGVSFEEGTSVFEDVTALHGEDVKHSTEELRSFALGKASSGQLLTVIYTVRRLRNGQEAIRIISARRASRKEREAYARQ